MFVMHGSSVDPEIIESSAGHQKVGINATLY